jgi:hypothetical protein
MRTCRVEMARFQDFESNLAIVGPRWGGRPSPSHQHRPRTSPCSSPRARCEGLRSAQVATRPPPPRRSRTLQGWELGGSPPAVKRGHNPSSEPSEAPVVIDTSEDGSGHGERSARPLFGCTPRVRGHSLSSAARKVPTFRWTVSRVGSSHPRAILLRIRVPSRDIRDVRPFSPRTRNPSLSAPPRHQRSPRSDAVTALAAVQTPHRL